MVKFVGNDESGLPLKRKQVAQACDSCRKRKKRCVHEYDLSPEDSSPTYNSESPTKPVRRVSHNAGETPDLSPTELRSQGSIPPQPESRAATRFVGDLNPRHLFIEATSPHSARDLSVRGGVGVWESRNTAQDARSAAAPRSAPSLIGPSQTMQNLLAQQVQVKYQTCVPAVQDWFALRNIYLGKQDPLYPVINIALADGQDAGSILVRQVISLAAAANSQAMPHLRLLPNGVLLSRPEFTAALSVAIYTTVESGLITDRVLLIRVLLLFSMYMQPTCPEEADMPTAIFAKAAHQFMTLGLHLDMGAAEADHEDLRSLFLCTWALDRLNSAIYGRSCTVHERDIGWDFEDSIKRQNPPFRLLLSVVNQLEDVIDLYRPQKDKDFIDMPILEQLIIDSEATQVSETLLATVEVFYHAVAILSCRVNQELTKSALPSRANNSRRSLSADRITELVRDSLGDRDRLSYLPIIPYAVSLSLSVMYRKMRYSQIPMFRERGLRAFEANTKLLKQLGETFWTAKTTGEMAERVLQEMGRATAFKNQESGKNSVREGSDPHPLPAIQTQINGLPRGLPLTTLPPPSSMATMMPEAPIPEIDIWEHINPQFNIGAIEAAFQNTLDMQAVTYYDWGQNPSWPLWNERHGVE
ncbi:hypothetical protein PFICI_14828 [Pestalotiopsis fici W106-1]|uniref:Transcription factor domain-containing protein n=1 Tax=Pestalotiopsis fici (strain W106-1 / CGMCC3.15140) TaxID=1229662 RepID=W3WL51_PESFW|nr:uncharacterized protein PFICI_14828 [Pestalotiopsis fici W106-1]ETS73882.1 hypothetical protein PFICI_14828 [Pestalotiopsis fici W106-1]